MNQSPPYTKQILQVAVPSPLRSLFDYLPPSTVSCAPVVGARVVVPFGKRTLLGIIVAIKNTSDFPIDKLKPALEVLDNEALFPPQLMELFLWAGNYYQYPLGMLFAAALPGWLRKPQHIDAQAVEISAKKTRPALQLNDAQLNAVTQVLQKTDQFQAFLLDGITGSGKTEVYMQLIAQMLEQNKQVLILVPEINLTPQTLQHFEERFNVPIAVMHSQISEKQRALYWKQAQQGIAKIILGTRLAAFVPLKNSGLFIIDEEHDLSFKQQDHFRYSARDLLLKRAQLEKCPMLLGSATPSLETWHNMRAGKFIHLQLPTRAGDAQPPVVEIIDTRHKKLDTGLSSELLLQIKQQIEQQNQVLIFLNRRGYAPVLMCYKCGWHQTCKRCDSNMILHANKSMSRCHHCEAQNKIPSICPQCENPEISPLGIGTQRLEDSLKQHFPDANIARIDRDSVHTKKQLNAALAAIHAGTTNILIGTQMLAKGHHFPNLTLVAIVDIDGALFSADFRATERMGQLITQVAGRTGRGHKLGKVILQTTHPENHLLNTLIYKGYHEFLKLLIQERQDSQLPPYSYHVLFRAETKTPTVASDFLNSIKHIISNNQAIACLGPIPAPMEKRQGFYRAQLLLQAKNRHSLQTQLQNVISELERLKLTRRVRWSVDVDPLEMF